MAPAPHSIAIAATVHIVGYPAAAATAPRPSGPMQPPAYTPVWVIDVAAAGAWGCSRTTAKFIRPGQDHPRPKPSTTPTTSGNVPGTASSARPTAPAASSPAMTAT